MSTSPEDVMCIERIQTTKSYLDEGEDVDIEVEKHYNHYGDRGVADLFTRTSRPNGTEADHVYEFKSDAAIAAATGANQILRQFNRMCSYFYEDETVDLPKASAWRNASVCFELCFDVTPTTYEHVLSNIELYQTVSTPPVDSALRDARAIVTFRDVDAPNPVLVASSTPGTVDHTRDEVESVFKDTFGDTTSGSEVFVHE